MRLATNIGFEVAHYLVGGLFTTFLVGNGDHGVKHRMVVQVQRGRSQ